MLFKNKTVVITGCNKGIGYEILKKFHKHGANIYACVRSKNENFLKKITELQKNSENKIYIKSLDLQKEESTKAAANEILAEKKDIDILINNAGDIYTNLFQMTSISKFKTLFDINFFNQIYFTQIILKSMIKKKGGNILFISSSSASDGTLGRSAYASTKGVVNSFVKVLARELGTSNIRVNAISPGLVDTDMANKNTKEEFKKDFIKSLSINRIGKPEEIASTVLSICSDDNSYLTGQIIRVDGGI